MSDDAVPVTLDKPRTLRFTYPAFKDLCWRLGRISKQEYLRRLAEQDPTAIEASLVAALKHEDPKMDSAKVEKILVKTLETRTLEDVVNDLGRALDAANLIQLERRRTEEADDERPS